MGKLREKKTTYILAGAAACVGCLAMIAFPAIALDSAEKGVTLWASSVLPALLPFFICANFMTEMGLPALVGRVFENPFRKLFGVPGVSAFIFSISITSGYPMGAKLIGDMGRNKEISREEAKRMLTFCSTSGPLFMLGAVGAGMLASPAAGAVIAISHYLGAVFNGFLFRILLGMRARKRGFSRQDQTMVFACGRSVHANKWDTSHRSLLEIFTDSILSSMRALGVICGYIVLFTMATDFMQFSGLFNYFDESYGKGLVKGFFEMTVGCNSIADATDLSLLLQCILCSAIISWGGLSILAQSMSMLEGLHISVWYYSAVKLCHGILAGLSALVIGPAILHLGIASVGAFGQKDAVEKLGGFYHLLFSSKMVIMVLVLFAVTILADKLVRRIHEGRRNHSGV